MVRLSANIEAALYRGQGSDAAAQKRQEAVDALLGRAYTALTQAGDDARWSGRLAGRIQIMRGTRRHLLASILLVTALTLPTACTGTASPSGGPTPAVSEAAAPAASAPPVVASPDDRVP